MESNAMKKRTKNQLGPPVMENITKDAANTVMEGIEGTDRPMEESHPYAPALLPFAIYPLLLAVSIIAAALWLKFW
jgi:hypothetical protein